MNTRKEERLESHSRMPAQENLSSEEDRRRSDKREDANYPV
jgi:hypothetical protein